MLPFWTEGKDMLPRTKKTIGKILKKSLFLKRYGSFVGKDIRIATNAKPLNSVAFGVSRSNSKALFLLIFTNLM